MQWSPDNPKWLGPDPFRINEYFGLSEIITKINIIIKYNVLNSTKKLPCILKR